MSGDDHGQADQPQCPSCGAVIEETVQHYVWVPALCEPLVHGEPGTSVLGHVDVIPCGCRVAPGEVTPVSAPQPLTGDELAAIRTQTEHRAKWGDDAHAATVLRLVAEVERLRERLSLLDPHEPVPDDFDPFIRGFGPPPPIVAS